MSDRTSPISTVFELQRKSIEQSQTLAERSLDVPRTLTETFANGVGTQRKTQERTIELGRTSINTVLDTVESASPAGSEDTLDDLRNAVDDAFDTVLEQQDQAYDTVDQQFDETLEQYDEISEESLEALNDQIEALLDANEELEGQTVDAIEQVLDQLEELQGQLEEQSEELQGRFEEQLERFQGQLEEQADRFQDLQGRVEDVQSEAVDVAVDGDDDE